MARTKVDQKPEVMRALIEHLNINGPSKYDEFMAKFPDLTRPTFFRWLKEAKEKIEDVASQHGTVALQLAQKRILTNTARTPEKAQEQLRAHMPVAPSPAIIASLPTGAVQQTFNFLAFFYEILHDVSLLRETAVTLDPTTGNEKAKNPMLLEKVVGKKLDILDTWIKSQEFLFGLEQMEELFRVVIEEIGKVSPEVQQAIMVRMRAANAAGGFNVNARL